MPSSWLEPQGNAEVSLLGATKVTVEPRALAYDETRSWKQEVRNGTGIDKN